MKFAIIAMLAAASMGAATAQEVIIDYNYLGPRGGTATKWHNDIYHSPQYMPGHPTAATLYPRVVDVKCTQTSTGLSCNSYNWIPEMGRGEYLMFRPVMVEDTAPPQVITNTVIKEVIREVLVEVPVKNKNQ